MHNLKRGAKAKNSLYVDFTVQSDGSVAVFYDKKQSATIFQDHSGWTIEACGIEHWTGLQGQNFRALQDAMQALVDAAKDSVGFDCGLPAQVLLDQLAAQPMRDRRCWNSPGLSVSERTLR